MFHNDAGGSKLIPCAGVAESSTWITISNRHGSRMETNFSSNWFLTARMQPDIYDTLRIDTGKEVQVRW